MAYEPQGRVEDFTNPFLVMAFVILLMAMIALWAVFGYAAALLAGFVLHLGIKRLPRRD